MKKLLWLFIPVIAILFACQKEIANERDPAVLKAEKKFGAITAGVKVPLKADFYSVPRMDLPPNLCTPTNIGFMLPGGFYVGGESSHTGSVRLMESPFTITGCGFTADGKLMMMGNGTIAADNGDKYYYTATTYSNMQDFTFTGTVIMDDGTGRFEGCTGEVTMVGTQSPTGSQWHAEGYIIMKKK
jgi:hypothetical protein